MQDDDDAAREFEALRGRLVAVAYGLLGSVDEAEDAVQESWLRLCRVDRSRIDDLTGWLIVTVARIARDALRSARHRREEYVGPWLPEPLVGAGEALIGAADPADRVTLDEALSAALMVVLESLSPAERTAFVLHEVFGMPFAEVGRVVGRGPAACRQLAARARRRVEAGAPRFAVSPAERRRVAAAFADACGSGNVRALLDVLDGDVVLRSDGGGVVRAARNPVHGADRVARYLAGVVRRGGIRTMVPATVNGEPGLLWLLDGTLDSVVTITVANRRVTAIDIVRNPGKLARVRRQIAPRPGSHDREEHTCRT
ncbi:RNA polymerase sigma factor SigJ [Actinoallomurus sp. CA-142502]|uniref:RNA polymerase sigma factor SigJ n=1 Tax=Actinoallomurus sp. CA-142502 TaxID=3239885 RepID=UPI003D934AFD